jgi:hypothetical protein
MIEKKRPRKLDSSKDARVRGADEMYDALNVQVSSDYDGAGSDSDGNAGGNVGVLKPAYGNSVNQYFEEFVLQSFESPNALKVLGNVVDDENDVIYYFVWSPIPKEQGIYAYDPNSFLPNQDGNKETIKVVYRSSLFNFPSDGFVKGDVVVIQDEGEQIKSRPIIYFTDGVNEPRSINVFLAYSRIRNKVKTADGGKSGSIIPSDDHFDIQDFIHACPKTPVRPPKAIFQNDFNSRTSNFEGVSGYQFAYQYIYEGGEESALSTYSDIIVPPAYLQQGAKPSANLSQTNECLIKIPRGSVRNDADLDASGNLSEDAISGVITAEGSSSDLVNRYMPRNVEKVRILVREGNRGAFSVVDTIDSGINSFIQQTYGQDPVGLYTDLTYVFRNDRVKTGFPKSEADKPFDNVPQVAGAQTVASNRLMYGDYVTGYDNVDVSASATITYNSRPEDFKSIDITVRPTIDLLNQGANVNNRICGIYFDVDNFPSDDIGLSDDSTVDFTITIRPKRNWHIYNSHNSFHGSRHIGNLSPNAIEEIEGNVGNAGVRIEPYEVSPNLASDGINGVSGVSGEPAPDGNFGSTRSRINEFSNLGLNSMWGANNGVTLGPQNPKWKTVASQSGVDPVGNFEGLTPSPLVTGSNSEVPVRYGTSAANPFILRGRPLLFSVSLKLKTNLSGSNYKKILRDFISRAITWDRENVNQADHFTGIFYEDGVSPYLEILDIKNEYSYTIDEGLNGGNANSSIEDVSGGANRINVTTKGDDRKHLIVAVGNGNVVKEGASYSDLINLPPCGYFIVNKATPTFRLRSRDDIDNTAQYGVLHVNLRSLTDVETLTCVPFIDSDLWLDKGMKLRNDDSDNSSNNPKGPEDTVYWWTAGIFEGGRFSDPDNWGLRDATAWQFQTMVVDSWYCFSKEYLVRRTLPEFLFTPLYSDYNRTTNGFTLASEELAADLGIDEDAAVGQPGDINPEVTNNGVLKNAAVVKQQAITSLVHYNARGVGGESDSKYGYLHFRHNMRLRVGGDGFYPALQHENLTFGQFNDEDPFSGPGAYDYLNLTPKYDKGRARIIGWIDSGLGYLGDRSNNIYNTGVDNATSIAGEPWESGFTILDGAGGIGANPTGGEATLRYDKGKSCAMGTVNGMMIFTGYIGPRETILPSKIKDGTKPPFDLDAADTIGSDRFRNYFNKFGQDCMMPFLGQFNYIKLSADGGYFWRPGTFGNPWPANDVKALYYTTPLDVGTAEEGQNVLDDDNFQNHDWRDDFRDQIARNQPVVEILDVGGGTVLADEIRSGGRSFKTRANHTFGIVFYDERGRAGRVNPIQVDGSSSLYVQGYDERTGVDVAGRVSIKLLLDDVVNTIPSWARHYQIVYAGNSTFSNFVQYSTGGAFVSTFNEGEAEQDSQNIYVSLNYLQGNKDVSYTEAFGAVSPSGTKQMYVHSPGDKLRVISYFVSNPIDEDGDIDGRVFPVDYEFEIVGVENLSGNPESNPLRRAFSDSTDSSVMSDAKTGQFLVLKNNPFAAGFSYDDVKNGENDPSSNKHFWNNICVVEIYSPSKEVADEDQRLYYETSQVYDIGISDGTIVPPVGTGTNVNLLNSGTRYYKTNPVLLEKGDVWFRRVPLAVPKFDTDPDSETFGRFRNLITYDKDNEVGSTPRFENYFLETKAFNDTFSGNDVLSRGKPNIIDDEFGSSRKKSSIIFSDKHVYDKSKLRFSSFKENSFKDFPAEHGPIRYLMDNYDSIVMIQERKTSAIPVERSILSTADGSNSLVQNKEPLGIQSFYAGDYGCDKNPESVIRAGGVIYFASPKAAEVYRLSIGSGIEVISSLGLKSEFYKTFRYVKSTTNDSTRVYVPTGYDPINDEFLITIRTEGYTAPTGPNENQGSLGQPVEDTGDDIFGGVDEAPEGCMYLEAVNADPFALVDDGNCFVFGCTDALSLNHVTPPAEGVEVIPCNEKGNSTVGGDGETYPNPYDCECRYFNPCIFDAFSLVPNGRVTFSDVYEFLDLTGSSSFTVPDIPGEYFPNHAQQLFTAGVINNLGLDFLWAANLPSNQTPPPSLAPGGTGWSFSSDIFDNQAYHHAVAAYTEGPDMTGFNFGDPAWTGSIQETWNASPDVNYDDATGTWTLATTGEPIWTAPWSQAPSGNTLENFNGAEDGCVYIGCSDSNALNYDPLAVTCSPEATDQGDFDIARFDDDDDPFNDLGCPDGFVDCDPQISGCGCKGISSSTQCYSACCNGATVTHRFGCLTNFNHVSYGRSNINPNTDPYGVLDYLQNATSLGNEIIIETTPTAGFPAPSLYCPTNPQAFYDAVTTYMDNRPDPNAPAGCGNSVTINYNTIIDCDDDGIPEPDAETDYYYWIDCCQYQCQGDYPVNVEGSMDNTGNADNSVRTDDFVLPGQGGVAGIPACYNGDYPSTDYSVGDLNPDFDYNPNVSGDQP